MMRTELTVDQMEQVNGGWSIFDPVKKAVKTALQQYRKPLPLC